MMRRAMLVVWILVAVSGSLAAGLLRADNWPQWRGPEGNGVAPTGSYPVEWGPDQNVLWKAKLPGLGASTPVVWEDRIFLTCGVDGQNTLQCFDRAGRSQWQQKLGDERPGKHKKASGSNPSAITDGRHVFAYFKSGDLACVSLDGSLQWHKNLQDMYGEDTLWWDLGTSPVLTAQHVVVAVMQSGPSFLVALDKETGDVAWKQDRTLEAPLEATQSYTTPAVVEHDGRQLLCVLGADHVTAHDAESGKEIWRVGGLNPEQNGYFRSIASPVVSQGVLIAPYARGESLTAIRLGGSGDVTDSHVLWKKTGLGADVPTPVAEGDRVYVCTDKGEVACLNLRDGQELWRHRLERHRMAYSASPVLADNRLYLTREDGTTFVLDVSDAPRELARNELDEFTVATPVFCDQQVLLRTSEHLYCFGR